jgi:hypothetical protein
MDMTPTLEAKSNQLTSDDLIAGPKTITVTKVTAGSAEQPVAVYYDGDQGKPWYPCKSMRRVLVAAWGADAKGYIGRSMTLFRDPEVSYGGIKVGGIRISHLSDLDSPLSIAFDGGRARSDRRTRCSHWRRRNLRRHQLRLILLQLRWRYAGRLG